MDLPRPEMFDFHGVHMTHYFTDNWEKVQNFKARPNDIVVATYPKSGTTWVSYILDLLHFRQTDAERENTVPLDERVPFLEFFMPSLYTPGTEMADMLSTTPRIIKTHLPVQFMPKSFWEQSCRIVYVARNAKDNVVSYFHFDCTEKIQPEPGDWKSFLQRFKDGKMVFGSWYDHVCGWWEKKQMYSNIHYMFFEDLVEDTGREIRGLCSFLGLSPSEDEREKIRGAVQFDVMKANPLTNLEDDTTLDFSISQFMRKGKVGDWKNHFTVAQNEQFDEHYKQMMKNATLQFRTEI
ncbi:cytosolic sulfotransferase 2-like [Electrophorus electricus]|uniref:Sulfotransferase n=1 Tax=Electrophorus electricus TaxID=8005 RepID=A0A4W4DP08_ELEEL|nr:cytosolic sulfotransferase 2-like [Electrophorus electricus]